MLNVHAVQDRVHTLKMKSLAKAHDLGDKVKAKAEKTVVEVLDRGIALTEKQLSALKTVRQRQG